MFSNDANERWAIDDVAITGFAPDTTPPTFATGSPAASAVAAASFLLSSTINEVGKTYYVVLASGASAPTAAQVKAGQNAAGTAIALAGSFTNPTANTTAASTVSGLASGTSYDVYVVAEDGVPNLQASPAVLAVTTTVGSTIVTGSIAPATVVAGNDVTVAYSTTGAFDGANVFTAVLSNAAGTFSSGTTTLTTTGSTATSLTVTIPAATAAGSAYLIRVDGSSPATTGSNSTSTLTVTAPLAAPTVTTTAASAITSTSATSGGDVTANGGAAITARGVVYGTSATPRLGGAGVTQVADGAPGTGPFTSSLTALSSSTMYYVAAYATNSLGTSYGTDRTFTTPALAVAPTVTTTTATAITFNSATSGGDVTASGGATITARGVVYGTSPNPQLGGPGVTQVANGSPGTGAFTSSLTGLSSSTTYYVAAYATTSVGTSYGADQTFATTVAPLLAYTFPASSSTSPTTQATGVTGSAFSRAASLSQEQNTPDFRSSGFPTSTASPAAGATTGYHQFTFTLAAGNTASLTSLVVSDRSSGTGPTRWEVRTSLDGYAATVGSVQMNPTTTLTPRTVNLTGTPALATVVGAVTFRIYAYGGSNSSTGTFAVDDVNLYGTTSASVPPAAEPTAQPTVAATAATATTVQLTLSGGDGTRRLVVVRPTAAGAVAPFDGTTYTANAAYGTATGTNPTTGTSNYVVIADGTTTSLTVTGLPSSTAYTVEAYAYNDNGTAGRENYLTTAPATATFTTATPPAVAYTWNGTGTSYSAAASWTPTRPATAASDVLVFDGSVTPTANVTLDFATPETIAALKLQGGVIATFSTDADRTLNLSGAATPANLVVGPADSLRLFNTVANVGLTIQLAAGATASIDGGIAADGSPFSSGTTHKIQGTSATPNAIVFHTGSGVTATANFGGNLFGNATGFAGTVLFEAGASYFQLGGGSPFGGAGPNASTTFQSGSYYRFMAPILATPSFSGRTYGTFVYNPGFTTAPTVSGGNPLVIQNDLRVLTGNLPLNLTGSIAIKGDIKVDGSANLSFQPASVPTAPLQLNGTTVQTIGGTNSNASGLTLNANVTLQINNAQGVLLLRPLTVPGTLQLTSGNVTTSAANLLTMANNATGGSATSFVDGPVGRLVPANTISTAYIFPVGKQVGAVGNYRPLTLNVTDQGSTATLYRAEQLEGNPGQAGTDPLANDGTTLTRVSRVRSFSLMPYDPASPATELQPTGFSGTVALSFDADDRANMPGATSLVIAKRSASGQPWANIGRTGNTASTVISGAFNSFSDFALASTDPDLSINPLPVELTAFSAQRQADKTVAVKWATASEKNSARFEVQRSRDGREFATIATVGAQGSSTHATAYVSLDKTAPTAKLYYRLRQVDLDGTATFSPMATVIGSGEVARVLLYPNPAQSRISFTTEVATSYRVLSQLGQPLLHGTTEAGPASIGLETLPTGLYFLELQTAAGRTVQKFEKE